MLTRAATKTGIRLTQVFQSISTQAGSMEDVARRGLDHLELLLLQVPVTERSGQNICHHREALCPQYHPLRHVELVK